MKTLDAIKTRRSIRKFKSQPVDKDKIEILLAAAMSAPSAFNRQPWEFIVVDDRKTLDAIPSFSDHAHMITQAPLAILICADTNIENSIEHCFEGCSAATQNLLLAIHELNLGAVWTGVYPNKDRIKGFKELFNLPSHIEPIALIVIGHSDESPKQKENYKNEKIHLNTW